MSKDVPILTMTNGATGETITLCEGSPTSFGWKHICARRPFMASELQSIKATVEAPDYCHPDPNHADRQRLYRFGALTTHPNLYLKVVVGDVGLETKTIITAHPTDNMLPGGGARVYVNK